MSCTVKVKMSLPEVHVKMYGAVNWNNLTGKPIATAENDFIVADASLSWVKRTIAQVRTIIGLGTAAFQNIAYFALASHTQSASTITPLALQTVGFANPLTFDVTTYKDWTSTITGNTVLGIANAVDGDAGMLILPVTGAGGYTVTFNAAMFTKKVGATSLDLTTGKTNIVSWRKLGTEVYYTVNQVV